MYYRTTAKLYYRTGPGKSYKKVGTLKKGTLINVVSTTGKWHKFKKGGKLYYCSAKYSKAVKHKVVNYGKVVAAEILPLANRVIKNKAKHVSGAYPYTGPKINCSVFVSTVLANAGLMKKEFTLYHTAKDHSKKTLNDVVKNRTKVKHYKWYKTKATYKNLPSAYKKPGCVYVYPSSIGILASKDYIYGCHSSGKTYTSLGMIKHTSGYEFTADILAVGVPQTE